MQVLREGDKVPFLRFSRRAPTCFFFLLSLALLCDDFLSVLLSFALRRSCSWQAICRSA